MESFKYSEPSEDPFSKSESTVKVVPGEDQGMSDTGFQMLMHDIIRQQNLQDQNLEESPDMMRDMGEEVDDLGDQIINDHRQKHT